jgi:hypothetical protein
MPSLVTTVNGDVIELARDVYEAHDGVGLAVDEDDLVDRVEQGAQPGGGRDAAETGTEDEDVRHETSLGWSQKVITLSA